MRNSLKQTRLLLVIALLTALLVPGAVMAEEIKIGVLFPLTGGAAASGRELRSGAELAQEIAGHAEHHYAYLFEAMCFSGDVGGVRIPGYQYLRVPMPPPELNLQRWHESIARLRSLQFKTIAPTHFGTFDDVDWHLNEVEKGLDAAARWLEGAMPSNPTIEELRGSYTDWIENEGRTLGLDENVVRAYELATRSA